MYQTALDPERIRGLQTRLQGTVERFAQAHERFLEKMRAVADEV